MTESEAISKMKSPSQFRQRTWLNGVMQIHITRACDRACFGCTQGSNLGGKTWFIPPDQFELAVKSLDGYFGVYGMFGGSPSLSPHFNEYCEILRKWVPWHQRGLWSNHPLGKGDVCRVTFNPAVSNLNVHESQEAYDEFARDWPESIPYLKGLDSDSRHSPPFVAMKDIISDEGERWELISNCDVNQFWSAMICWIPNRGLRAYFCELAAAQAILHYDDPHWPDLGLEVTNGWWKRPIEDFKEQIKFHCHSCGIPLRRYGQLANGGEYEEVSETHKDIYKPKRLGRKVELVTVDSDTRLLRATDYIENGSI